MKGCRVIDTEPKAQRANEPGDYVCPNCGEHLSGPARFYTCPMSGDDLRAAIQPERTVYGVAA
jgi:hypothetical protein